MRKTKQTSTELLVIVITTIAIIAAATTTSISAARPAFAKVNCNETICSGGTSFKQEDLGTPGGHGSHTVFDESTSEVITGSGGFGQNAVGFGGSVDGAGFHQVCNASSFCPSVGGSGVHPK